MVKLDADTIQREVQDKVLTGGSNPYEAILMNADRDSVDWMQRYGLPVSEGEIQMMRFWFSLPRERLVQMADHMIDAFLHGFVSQSRERGSRRRVRISYCLGQEALARQLVIRLKERSLLPVVEKPKTQDESWERQKRGAFADLSQEELEAVMECYGKAIKSHESAFRDTCGMIGIGQFGRKPLGRLPNKADSNTAGQDEKEAKAGRLYFLAEQGKAALEAEYVKPSEISFCRAAFPDMQVGERFEEIFHAFFELNLMDSEPYELAQQALIDSMDKCTQIEIKGGRGNLTDLTISLFPIRDERRQTKFLNCGGDLNLPFGEVFTTPRLAGTGGLLHVPCACLKGWVYHDLKLWFEHGTVERAECQEGAKYLRENLFQGSDYVPAGEFAIGTNTFAYTLARRYGLENRLPILISEKTGPHLAIGDSCFARAEDVPVYNMYDRKEMVCRENEVCLRNGKDRCYCGFHVDITLPYDQIEYVWGRTAPGETVPLIENGRFVVEGTQELNTGLEVQY